MASEQLTRLLIDLAVNPHKVALLKTDPDQLLAGAGLTPAEEMALKSGDVTEIHRALSPDSALSLAVLGAAIAPSSALAGLQGAEGAPESALSPPVAIRASSATSIPDGGRDS